MLWGGNDRPLIIRVYVRKRELGNKGLWLEENDKKGGELVGDDSVVGLGDTCQSEGGDCGKAVSNGMINVELAGRKEAGRNLGG